MSGPSVGNRLLRYVASFLVLLFSIGAGVGVSYAVPVNAGYHEVLTWATVTTFALLGLELVFRIEEGRTFLGAFYETVDRT